MFKNNFIMPSDQQKHGANLVNPLVCPIDYVSPSGYSGTVAANAKGSNTGTATRSSSNSKNTDSNVKLLSSAMSVNTTTKPLSTSKSSASRGAGGASRGGASRGGASRSSTNGSSLQFNTREQINLLAQCKYVDKTIWATRVLMGGNSVNGFLRSTAAAQRIKKQRARQNKKTGVGSVGPGALNASYIASGGSSGMETTAATNNSSNLTAGSITSNLSKSNSSANNGSSKLREVFNQTEEELLKKDIMNPRTAKKIKVELEQGIVFCATVCNVLRGALFDLDHSLSPVLPPYLSTKQESEKQSSFTFLIPSNPPKTTLGQQQQQIQQLSSSSSRGINKGTSKIGRGGNKTKSATIQGTKGNPVNKSTGISKSTPPQYQKQQSTTSQNTALSAGEPGNSTLRRIRKNIKKSPGPSTISIEPAFANLPPEFDTISNKRTCTKKEYQYRLAQILRYRDLKQGDFVAARLSSRDLWILAKVLKDYRTTSLTSIYTLSPLEFVILSDARRDALFLKERVMLEDVEDQGGQTSGTQVARNLVLPLPRTSAEANEWADRLLKKGSRVYAMYPQTTSLYAATVIDCTTYCREEDDIIIVVFDGEEADISGNFPSYHVSLVDKQ